MKRIPADYEPFTCCEVGDQWAERVRWHLTYSMWPADFVAVLAEWATHKIDVHDDPGVIDPACMSCWEFRSLPDNVETAIGWVHEYRVHRVVHGLGVEKIIKSMKNEG